MTTRAEWTWQERNKLLRCYHNGVPIAGIATRLGRTRVSIVQQLRELLPPEQRPGRGKRYASRVETYVEPVRTCAFPKGTDPARCLACNTPVWIDTDGCGGLVEYDSRGEVHACARLPILKKAKPWAGRGKHKPISVTDDEAWRIRDVMTWTELAKRENVSPGGISTIMSRRGWVRKRGGDSRVLAAPCKHCGVSTEVAGLNAMRECTQCRQERAA
jgi:hypothetical protein